MACLRHAGQLRSDSGISSTVIPESDLVLGNVPALIRAMNDGTVKTYSGTYTVSNGVIVAADIVQTS